MCSFSASPPKTVELQFFSCCLAQRSSLSPPQLQVPPKKSPTILHEKRKSAKQLRPPTEYRQLTYRFRMHSPVIPATRAAGRGCFRGLEGLQQLSHLLQMKVGAKVTKVFWHEFRTSNKHQQPITTPLKSLKDTSQIISFKYLQIIVPSGIFCVPQFPHTATFTSITNLSSA